MPVSLRRGKSTATEGRPRCEPATASNNAADRAAAVALADLGGQRSRVGKIAVCGEKL
jgi:hypothetical protein